MTAIILCSAEAEDIPTDFQLGKTLKLLMAPQKIQNKDISNPYLSRGVPMVTIFVCSAGSSSKSVLRLIEKASRADIRLAEMEHPSLKIAFSYCFDSVSIYVHPCFYTAWKLKYSLDVTGVSRDSWVITEFGIGSLRHGVSEKRVGERSWRAVGDGDGQMRSTPDTVAEKIGSSEEDRVRMSAFQLLCGIFPSNPC